MHILWGPLIALLGNLVKGQIGFWITAALAAFGLHLVAQEFVLDPILSQIQGASSGLGADGLAWFSYLAIDEFITAVLSAYASAATFSGIRMARKAT